MFLRTVALAVALLALVCDQSLAQVRIPQKPPGFTAGKGSPSAGVQLEAYIDLLCPFSKLAYAGVKQLAAYYDPEELRVAFVLFPLPYHQNAFLVAESAFAITSVLGEDSFTPWLETVYRHQERFWNKAASDLTAAEVTDKLREVAQDTFPDLTRKQWESLMTGYGGTEADFQARAVWDYACTRGVSGTPSYVLNGVPFEAADASWDFQDWFAVIDPLVRANKPARTD